MPVLTETPSVAHTGFLIGEWVPTLSRSAPAIIPHRSAPFCLSQNFPSPVIFSTQRAPGLEALWQTPNRSSKSARCKDTRVA